MAQVQERFLSYARHQKKQYVTNKTLKLPDGIKELIRDSQ